MLTSQFSPLNSFGINGDIFCTVSLDTCNIFGITFYNVNPDYDYDFIDFPFNFGCNIKSAFKNSNPDNSYHNYVSSNIRYIEFENFNQSQLILLLSNPSGFLANTYSLSSFELNNDPTAEIELTFNRNAYNFDYFYCCDNEYVPKSIPFSNVAIRFIGSQGEIIDQNFFTEAKGSEGTARYMFYGTNFFNKEKKFKEIDMPFLYFDDLTYCFGCNMMSAYNGDTLIEDTIFTDILGNYSWYGDPLVRNIDHILTGRYFKDNYYENHPEGFLTNLSFPKLDSAIGAFNCLILSETDIQNLLNALPTKTDGKEHHISFADFRGYTAPNIDEYINKFAQKGWTLTTESILDEPNGSLINPY